MVESKVFGKRLCIKNFADKLYAFPKNILVKKQKVKPIYFKLQ